MSTFQQVTIVGNLGNDPKIEATTSGTVTARMSVATTEHYKDRDGNRKEETSWHSVRVYGNSAEYCGKYMSKGSKVLVSGKLRYSKSAGKDGIDRYYTDIIAKDVQFLDPKREGSQPAQRQEPGAKFDPNNDEFKDDIPF